jgi:hypothetical protein
MKHIRLFENFREFSRTFPPVITVGYDFDGITKNGKEPEAPYLDCIYPSNYYITYHTEPSTELLKKALKVVDADFQYRTITDQDLEDIFLEWDDDYGPSIDYSDLESFRDNILAAEQIRNVRNKPDEMMLIMDHSITPEDCEEEFKKLFDEWNRSDYELWLVSQEGSLEDLMDENVFTQKFIDYLKSLLVRERMREDGIFDQSLISHLGGNKRFEFTFKVI